MWWAQWGWYRITDMYITNENKWQNGWQSLERVVKYQFAWPVHRTLLTSCTAAQIHHGGSSFRGNSRLWWRSSTSGRWNGEWGWANKGKSCRKLTIFTWKSTDNFCVVLSPWRKRRKRRRVNQMYSKMALIYFLERRKMVIKIPGISMLQLIY